MPCFYPMQAYYSRYLTKSGKRAITFDRDQSYGLSTCELQLPCGKCRYCRLMYARQWAMRCMHETQLHDRNSFITLTFRDSSLPANRSLDVKYFQDFMKRLRKRFSSPKFLSDYPNYFKSSGIRFFHCGEYGSKFRRPHYHAILFGCDFPDRYEFIPKGSKPVNGIKYYRSDILEDLWPHGYCIIGDVTFESCSYVARYCMKKVDGPLKDAGYYIPNDLTISNIDVSTGEVIELKPEYCTMSRRSAIGKDWYDKFKGDVYPHDFTYLRDRKMRPPKYYDRMYEIEYPDQFSLIKAQRKRDAIARDLSECPTGDSLCKSYRLDVKERISDIMCQKLVRVYDSEC